MRVLKEEVIYINISVPSKQEENNVGRLGEGKRALIVGSKKGKVGRSKRRGR